LSYRSPSTGSRSGRKGSSAKDKKLRKKKQEFHRHKIHGSEAEKSDDLGELKSRTIAALNRLGHQTFSLEAGGYGLESWMKSFDVLLDDFEEKVGSETPLDAFHAKRAEVTGRLLAPIDFSSIDNQMEEIRRDEEDLRRGIEEERERVIARQNTIESEKLTCVRSLELERRALEELDSARQSRGLLSRLLRRSEDPREPIESRKRELEAKIQSLDQEMQGLQRIRVSIERHASPPKGAPHEQLWKDLEALRLRSDELRVTKQVMAQRATEREQATTELAEMVSKISVEETEAEQPTEFTESSIQRNSA